MPDFKVRVNVGAISTTTQKSTRRIYEISRFQIKNQECKNEECNAK
jgi:hypothetical protein